MNNDPVKEWQRLTRLYSEMQNDELRELATNLADLTDIAQQVLQDELRRRGLNSKDPSKMPSIASSDTENASQDDSSAEEALPWILYESGDVQPLNEFQEILNQAGISSQIVNPQENVYRTRFLQLQVAEKDADLAEKILLQPREPKPCPQTPKEETEDFESPSCTQCGASNPLLESVEPFNTWLCENCGARWTESSQGLEEKPSGL
jgi:hypothetical protein